MLAWPQKVSGVGTVARRLAVGAEVQPRGGTHFRVWAPRCARVRVQVRAGDRGQETGDSEVSEPIDLHAEEGGYFAALIPEAQAGDLYWFLLDEDELQLPDPASRFQPKGPHGPSEIIGPSAYAWGDANWQGVRLSGQVI